MNQENNPPYIVLATYKPLIRKCSAIGRDLTAITRDLGLKPFRNDEIKRNTKAAWSSYSLHAEVRKTAVPGSEAEGFHQDGDTSTRDMDFAMVVWASKTPTEVRVGSNIFQPKPYELVIFRNLACYHRRPKGIEGKRYFFRQRVVVPKHIQLP